MAAGKAFRELRRRPETVRIPVLMVSVLDPKQDIASTGAASCLVKPVDREVLHQALRQHVQARPGNPPKILVFDDESSFLNLIQEVLGGAGYVPILSNSGRKALEMLERTQVSIVIVDLTMPDMDGFEFIFRIKEQARFKDPPSPRCVHINKTINV